MGENGKEFFHFEKIFMLSGLSLEKFVDAISIGDILVDFDARTGPPTGARILCFLFSVIYVFY